MNKQRQSDDKDIIFEKVYSRDGKISKTTAVLYVSAFFNILSQR